MRNIVICTNIDNKSFNALAKIKDYVDLKKANITLLHIWNSKAYDYPGDLIVPFYPNEEQAQKIESNMKDQLESQFMQFDGLAEDNFNTHVFSSSNPKSDAVSFINKNKSNLVACMVEQKGDLKHFFHSSFASYINSHAPCDVLSIRLT